MTPSNMRISAGRGAWGLASQALSTTSNVAASLFVATSSSSEAFGAWSIGYASYLAALTIVRAVFATPLLLHGSDPDGRQSGGAFAATVFAGLMTSALLAVAAAIAGPTIRSALIGFAVAMPALLTQDITRQYFIATRRPNISALVDGIWLTAQGIAFAVIFVTIDHPSPLLITLCWGFGAFISVFGLAFKTPCTCSPALAADYFRTNTWASSRLLGDSLLNSASTQALPLIIAATSGLAATGALRAGQTLFGVMGVAVAGLVPIMTVEAVRALREGGSGTRLVGYWSAILGIFGAVYGIALFTIPTAYGEALLGESWRGASSLLLPLTFQAVLRGPYTGVPIVMRARNMLTQALGLRLSISIPSLLLPALGAVLWGVQGAAWFMVVATILSDVIAIFWLMRIERRVALQNPQDSDPAPH